MLFLLLGRMQDIELMHMRYTLESTALALGAMENSLGEDNASHHQVALCYLKDLKNHLEAITNIPRKVISGSPFSINMCIFYLHSFCWDLLLVI